MSAAAPMSTVRSSAPRMTKATTASPATPAMRLTVPPSAASGPAAPWPTAKVEKSQSPWSTIAQISVPVVRRTM